MKIPAFTTKIKIILLSIAGLLLIYSVSGFFILPTVLSDQITKITKENFNRNTQIEVIEFNPFSMELNIQGIEVKNLDDSPFFNARQLYVNLAVLRSTFNLNLLLDKVVLDQPDVLISRTKQGDFNFSDLLNNETPENKQTSKEDGLFPIEISETVISNGKLSWKDNFYSQSQREDIYPLNLNINNFTTIVGKQSELGFSLQFSSGGQFEWNGQLELSPLKSAGKIKIEKVELHRIWELFLQDSVNFKILKGKELIEADYQLTETKQGFQFHVNNAHIDIYDLILSDKEKQDNQPLISIPEFKISGISMDLLKKKIGISNVSAKDASFKAWLSNDGNINYQSLFANQSNSKQPDPQNQPQNNEKSTPWHINLDRLAFNNFALNFEDRTVGDTPVNLDLNSFNLESTGLTSKLDQKIPFKLDLNVNDKGKITIKGQTLPQPFSAELELNAESIAIKNFQPYISKFARLDIISGMVDTNTKALLSTQSNQDINITLQGDTHINDFVSRDQISKKDFLNWKKLSLNKINIDLAENKFLIDTVKIDQPYSRVLIRKDKSININDIVIDEPKNKKAPAKPKKTTTKQESKSYFKIGKIEMAGGQSDFSDLSLIIPFSVHINRLKGSVRGISSEKKDIAKVTLNGRVGKLAPVNIKGNFSPYYGNSAFDLDFNSLPLPILTPYMADFAGRKIEKGKMTLGLKYKIKNKQLTASNNLLIDQLVLGDEVKNPDASSLPLDLAIALLQDVDGKITLDVPITGSLDDPEFSVTGLIAKALINIITKVVTSPFYAVSSLIEGGEDASKIIFKPGKVILEDKQKVKLQGIAKVLSNRPALNLEIKGMSYSKFDWQDMQAKALDQKILKIHNKQLKKENQTNVLVKKLSQTDQDYQQILAELFIKKHPELAEYSLFGEPRLKGQESGNFYQEAKAKLSTAITPDSKLLLELAVLRSQNIAKHLVDLGIALERIFLLDAVVDPLGTQKEIATTLNLAVN